MSKFCWWYRFRCDVWFKLFLHLVLMSTVSFNVDLNILDLRRCSKHRRAAWIVSGDRLNPQELQLQRLDWTIALFDNDNSRKRIGQQTVRRIQMSANAKIRYFFWWCCWGVGVLLFLLSKCFRRHHKVVPRRIFFLFSFFRFRNFNFNKKFLRFGHDVRSQDSGSLNFSSDEVVDVDLDAVIRLKQLDGVAVVSVVVRVTFERQLKRNFGFSGRNFSRIDDLDEAFDEGDQVARGRTWPGRVPDFGKYDFRIFS